METNKDDRSEAWSLGWFYVLAGALAVVLNVVTMFVVGWHPLLAALCAFGAWGFWYGSRLLSQPMVEADQTTEEPL